MIEVKYVNFICGTGGMKNRTERSRVEGEERDKGVGRVWRRERVDNGCEFSISI